jgi:hypothetical protein
MKRSLKLFTIVLLILLMVSFTTALALWFFLPREQVTTAITSELSKRLNQDITMDTFSVGFYPGVEFVTRNVRIADPSSSREILYAQTVRFDLDLRALLNRTFVVEDITVVSPQLDLVRNANGTWNVDDLIESVRSEEKKDDSSQSVSWFEFGQVNIKNGSIRINDKALGQQLNISSLEATFDIREESLSIDSASTVMDSLEAELSGTLSQLFKPSPLFDIQATIDVKKEGPLAELQSINLPPGAKIADIALDASGNFKEIALTATFALAPLTPAKLKTRGAITGTLQVEDGLLNLDTLKTHVGKNTLSLSGTLRNLWHKERTALLKGTTEISLAEVNKLTTAATLADVTIRGMANASIALTVSAEQIDLTTTIDLLRADIAAPQLVHKKRGVPGTLAVNAHYSIPDGKLTLDPFKADFGKNTLSLSGTLRNPWHKERTALLKGTTAISLDEVAKLTHGTPLADVTIGGMANASIVLTASAEQVDLTTTIDLLRTDIILPQLIHKTSGAPCELSIKALYSIPDELLIDEFALVLGKDKLAGKAQLVPAEDPWLQISFTTSGFSLEHLNRLPGVTFAEGTCGLFAKVWQSNPSSEDFHYSGEGLVDGAALVVKTMNEPFKNLSGRLEIVDNKAMLHEAFFLLGESQYRLDAEVTDFSTPRITGQLRTDLLDINKLIDAFDEQEDVSKEAPPSPETSPPDFSLELQVDADALHFDKVKTGAVSTLWKTSGRVQQFDPLQIKAFGGTLGGKLELAILEEGITWKTALKGEEMIIEDISNQLFEEGERVKGTVSAQGTLSGRADDDPEERWRSINGKLSYKATKTQFNESPLFKSMLLATRSTGMLIPGLQQISLANLVIDSLKSRGRSLNINQVNFHTINGTVHITDGLAQTEDSFFDADTVDLLFKGDIDLVKEDCNMKVRATPIGTIGSLVGKIPIIGKQIQRLRNATLSFSFNVTGPLADPHVQLTAVERLTPNKKE